MENQPYSEPEEKTNKTEDGKATVVPPDEDMLTSEPMNDRSGASTNASGPTVNEFSPPPFTGTIQDDEPQGPADPADHPFANPGLRDAPPHVKQEGAEFVADQLLVGYAELKKLGASLAILISERKMDRWEEDGIINRNIVLPVTGGGSATAGNVIHMHNNAAEKVINENALTQEFYDTAKPMLVEELSKRNIALTNMQQLLATTAVDLIKYGKVLKPFWYQRQDLIHAFKQATAAYNNAPPGFIPNYGAQQGPTQQPGAQQQPAPDPPPQPVTPVSAYEEPQASSVDTAFDDMQAGKDILRPTGPVAPLPSDVNEMVQMQNAVHRRRKKGSKPGVKRGPYNKKNKKGTVTVIPAK